MNTAQILRQLQNAGLNVLGADGANIYIEDPSCILRGFETFVEYAWGVIAIVTGLLLFGWAISLIRGANTDYVTNIRNLLIIFGTLAVAGPIVNLIWGGDLFGRGCRTVAVPIAGVEEILQARDKKFGPNDELFEVFDMLDSGIDISDIDVPGFVPPVNVPDATPEDKPSDYEVIPISNPMGPSKDISPTNNTEQGFNRRGGARRAISADADGRDVIYKHSDNSRVRYTGGTRAWRNTNPGNLRYSSFSESAGAIGRAGGFAVFPGEDVGTDALVALLRTDAYRTRTIADAVRRYAPPSENDTKTYMQRLSQLTGLDLNRRMGDLNDTEIRRVAAAIRQIEGWRSGRKIDM